MMTSILLISLLLPALSFSAIQCDQAVANRDLRIKLELQDIELQPVSFLKKSQLVNLLSEQDIERFYLGNKPAEPAASAFLLRSKSPNGGHRETFDGMWAIIYKNKPAGILAMSAVSPEWLPSEVQSEFQKQSNSDLYLAVGYALKSQFRGQGIVSRALSAAIDYAKSELKAKYLFASANNLNQPSAEVLLSNGFHILFRDEKRSKFILRIN